jgi:4-hydroxy-tetrahydrodipicolinate reductase
MKAGADTKLKLALIGMGKMGRALEQLAPDRGFDVVARLDQQESARGAGITREALNGAEVAVEFTVPEAAVGNIEACVAAGCPVVVGTTGWYAESGAVGKLVAERGGAVLWAPNFSIGVNLFQRLVEHAAELVGTAPGFDVHLVETHHAAKKDAPSGTAGSLAHAVAQVLGREVPITSVRTGHVPGTHELVFDSPFETVRLEHVARDRRVFAEGALLAARWLVGRQGTFSMRDVLGFTSPRGHTTAP